MTADRLAERVRQALARKRTTEQAMFGGTCFMLNGNMILSASARGLLVRVGKDGMDAALKRAGARPMIMGGRTMAGYVFIAEEATKTAGALKKWVDVALAYVATLPPKKEQPATRRRTPAQIRRASHD
jgi:TfoX/Sxy family transcriptional regulator of competence genes